MVKFNHITCLMQIVPVSAFSTQSNSDYLEHVCVVLTIIPSWCWHKLISGCTRKGDIFRQCTIETKGAIIPKVSQLMTSTSATEVWYHIYTSKVKWRITFDYTDNSKIVQSFSCCKPADGNHCHKTPKACCNQTIRTSVSLIFLTCQRQGRKLHETKFL